METLCDDKDDTTRRWTSVSVCVWEEQEDHNALHGRHEEDKEAAEGGEQQREEQKRERVSKRRRWE